jgi:uncharacterized membrane protein YkoI
MKTSAKALTAGIVGLAIIGTSVAAFSSEFDRDGDHDRDSHNPEMVNQASLSAEQAIAIALAAIPGKVIESEIEMEGGTLVWEVEVLSSENKVYEFEIDASDGRIIERERDDS